MLKKLSAVVMLVAALAACSSSTPTGADGTPTSEQTAPPEDDANGTGGDPEEFCNRGEAAFEGNPFEGLDPSTPEALREGFTAAVTLFQDLLEVAPADVAVTIEAGVAAMVQMQAQLEAVDWDFSTLTPEDGQAFAELAGKFDFPAFARAAAAYCGG